MRFNGWHQSSCLNCGEKLIREHFWFLSSSPSNHISIWNIRINFRYLIPCLLSMKRKIKRLILLCSIRQAGYSREKKKKHENWYYSTLMSGKRDKTLLYLFQFYLFVSLLFICSVFLLFYVFRCAKKKSWQFAFSHINFFLQTI
jgi:hypothetical protein